MSKEMKMSDDCIIHCLQDLAGYEPSDIDCDDIDISSGDDQFCPMSIVNIASMGADLARRLADENAALREALRLKEAECEALAHDKSVLISFVKRVSEVDIEYWEYETDGGDSMCFEFIGETEIACDAADLLGDIKGADYYCQCENTECGAWYQLGKEGEACKECHTGKLVPQPVEAY